MENTSISQKEAEALAIQMVDQYMAACGQLDAQGKANVLMKLLSVTSVKLAKEAGVQEAIDRIVGTASFISRFQAVDQGAARH